MVAASKRSREESEVQPRKVGKSSGMEVDPLLQMGSVDGFPSGLLKAAINVMRGLDITEVFSPERVTKISREHGLTAGLRMDLRTGWDFRKKADRQRADTYIYEEKPLLVIGSPVCTPFSALQRWNWGRTKEGDRKSQNNLDEATRYMEFVAEFYAIQNAGRQSYLHENPAQTTS